MKASRPNRPPPRVPSRPSARPQASSLRAGVGVRAQGRASVATRPAVNVNVRDTFEKAVKGFARFLGEVIKHQVEHPGGGMATLKGNQARNDKVG